MTSERYGIDLLVIGAGIVGAAIAHYAARSGMRVTVLEREAVASGSTGAGEGNLLVSDKAPGPELDLARLSLRLWRDLAAEAPHAFEYEAKGGLVVASEPEGVESLRQTARRQRAKGVSVVDVSDPRDLEPHIRHRLPAAAHYPEDAQVMPALAAAHLLDHPGIRLRTGVTVTGSMTSRHGRIVGVTTTDGQYSCGTVVQAAGAAAGGLADALGAPVPVTPRRGIVLVTTPVPDLIRHKVYTADYLKDVSSDEATLQTSPVVESTAAGPVLIGASREHVGFDSTAAPVVWRRLAAGAMRLFPVLSEVSVMRAYCGFRPFSPDHLPIIGSDGRLPGLWHATGHEGAGVGLAAGTGHLLVQSIQGQDTDIDLTPFSPNRFEAKR